MEKNGEALIDHWEWAGTKGLMNKTSARLLRPHANRSLASKRIGKIWMSKAWT